MGIDTPAWKGDPEPFVCLGINLSLPVDKLPTGKYLVDFNFAYNPACAYSDHYLRHGDVLARDLRSSCSV